MNARLDTQTATGGSDASVYDVIIVGLGPTGLVLAHSLGLQGRSVLVLEKEPVFYGNARAVYTDDECMRIFQSLNVAKEVQSQMMLDTPVQFVRPDGSLMAQYMPLQRYFGWPVVNFFYQPYLETTLSGLLARHPHVEVRRGRELVDFAQDAHGVTVTHQATQEARFTEFGDARQATGGAQDMQTARTRYLVGCDGGRSVVRTKLGIDMTGKNFPEPWLVVDLQRKPGVDGLRHLPYFNFVVDPKLPVVSCVQPDGFHRFEFMLTKGETKENMERPETVRHYLSKFIDPDLFEIKRRLVYTFNALMAKEWRRGRVFLAGDAAHMTPQFMGQGASSGFRDAANLGWKLGLVLQGKVGERVLDSYEQERKAHAQQMIDVSVFLKNVVSMTHPIGTLLRDAGITITQTVGPLKRWFRNGGFKPLPIYKKGCYLGLSRKGWRGPEGVLSPQPEVRCFDSSRVLLDDLLGFGFSLVGLNVNPLDHLDAQGTSLLESLGTCMVTLYAYGERPQGLQGVERHARPGAVEVEDIDGHMIKWFRRAGFKDRAIAVLRPDKFTFAVVPPEALPQTLRELARQLDASPSQVVPLTRKAA
jgi:3-(3-hydroxy-phenyl)propionate hydroxylase